MARRIPTTATVLLATCLLGGGGALADQTRQPPRFSDSPSVWRLGERILFVSPEPNDIAGAFDRTAMPGTLPLLEAQPGVEWLGSLSAAGRRSVPPPREPSGLGRESVFRATPAAADDAARVVGPGPASTLLVVSGAAFAARAGWRRV